MLNKIMKLIFLVLFIITFLQSCDTTEPEKNGSLLLNLEEVSCTETWLSLKATSDYLPEVVNIFQENKIVAQLSILNKQDTIIYIDSLQPSSSYNFVAQAGNLKSNIAVATTMDTTSHNFTWQTFTFGENVAQSSYLNDVTVIDENNIWAVGAIYMNDSLGNPDPNAYNAVHWNGTKWELKKIMFYTICGQTSKSSYPTNAIFALNDSVTWISAGNQIATLRNNIQYSIYCFAYTFGINKIWGKPNGEIYVIGAEGKIAITNGTGWNTIESGTDKNLYGISGSEKSSIFCVGGNVANLSSVVIKGSRSAFEVIKEGISLNYQEELFHPYLSGTLSSVWVSPIKRAYLGGHFLYTYKNEEWRLVKSLEGNYFKGNSYAQHWGFILDIEGTNENNIFMVGERNTLRHFNGLTWKQIGTPYNSNSDQPWRSIHINSDVVAVAGSVGNLATLIVLKK